MILTVRHPYWYNKQQVQLTRQQRMIFLTWMVLLITSGTVKYMAVL